MSTDISRALPTAHINIVRSAHGPGLYGVCDYAWCGEPSAYGYFEPIVWNRPRLLSVRCEKCALLFAWMQANRNEIEPTPIVHGTPEYAQLLEACKAVFGIDISEDRP